VDAGELVHLRLHCDRLSGLSRFVDGSAVVIAGNGANFRTAYYVTPANHGDAVRVSACCH